MKEILKNFQLVIQIKHYEGGESGGIGPRLWSVQVVSTHLSTELTIHGKYLDTHHRLILDATRTWPPPDQGGLGLTN